MVTVWQGSSSTCQRHHSTVLPDMQYSFSQVKLSLPISTCQEWNDMQRCLRVGKYCCDRKNEKYNVFFFLYSIIIKCPLLFRWVIANSRADILTHSSVKVQWSKNMTKNSSSCGYFWWLQQFPKSSDVERNGAEVPNNKLNSLWRCFISVPYFSRHLNDCTYRATWYKII